MRHGGHYDDGDEADEGGEEVFGEAPAEEAARVVGVWLEGDEPFVLFVEGRDGLERDGLDFVACGEGFSIYLGGKLERVAVGDKQNGIVLYAGVVELLGEVVDTP